MIFFSLPFRPDKVNLNEMYTRENKKNLQHAFDLAETELNVTKLLDPEGKL
jgi:hypothetical protein